MAKQKGKDCKVALGVNKIVGMGDWELPGTDTELLETTEFEDDYKTYEAGVKDGGEITFSGLYDPADVNGQQALREANENGTHVTDLRFYEGDGVSYWKPETTSPPSYLLITKYGIKGSRTNMMETNFTAKVCGKMTRIAG